ncbi:hypothetical protein PPL_09519 [Heterostelium album PN500]|uniref:Uncharacterized protein n=1 Tax=Heterostelium pallidum (strain ATCC 26659 / Pp 5 / PN500) TaxID=670386 RepID=D3BNA8_HETP5|nr:hypothetical protein PPL_09519 [Heterostelium album PN500]EFA76768.1 hypothetical protein PPL_09519 [Heterostelium album PN500]|eukprot:XP_020428900.1 hypothetical protein PPL_09519 [Heterostelium album PN500]
MRAVYNQIWLGVCKSVGDFVSILCWSSITSQPTPLEKSNNIGFNHKTYYISICRIN